MYPQRWLRDRLHAHRRGLCGHDSPPGRTPLGPAARARGRPTTARDSGREEQRGRSPHEEDKQRRPDGLDRERCLLGQLRTHRRDLADHEGLQQVVPPTGGNLGGVRPSARRLRFEDGDCRLREPGSGGAGGCSRFDRNHRERGVLDEDRQFIRRGGLRGRGGCGLRHRCRDQGRGKGWVDDRHLI